ncbi:MAG: ATP-binding protein, partial [Actinobacteria bacterium]|nr:ATP-binding protein [Actinomycetota bacterium]
MLIGREAECERIDELLDRARMGRSGALVLRGEPGIGKTALLDHAAARAEGMSVVRTLGVESEMEIEFSALLDICRPLLDLFDELPAQQADALRGALGLGPPLALDRFAIGAATLGLVATAAERQPLLVLVDDAQWLDSASADALLFATRRLDADRAVVLFAVRDDEDRGFGASGVASLRLSGLEPEPAIRLLASQVAMAPAVANRLYHATGGNPLALVELPGLLSSGQLRGEEPLDDPLPAGTSVERAFAGRADALPESARTALLVAAVSTSNASATIVAALEAIGLDATSLEPAED